MCTILLVSSVLLIAQEPADSLGIEGSAVDSVPKKKAAALDAEIRYAANDSIEFFFDGFAILSGDANVKYLTARPLEITADSMNVNMNNSTLFAAGRKDSTEVLKGTPIFKEGNDQYNFKEITYNMKTKKGYTRGGVTEQGEGYIVADKSKMNNDGTVCMVGGKYTTCDNHDHPHFYLQMSRAKVKPGSYIASGLAWIVLEDVPLPIGVPFGFFPFTSSYSSGIIMPSYGDEMERGFFLRNGGYYFAISDHFDLELTGDIYTKGTWALNLASNYVKRYKFSGYFRANYRSDVRGIKYMSDYNKSNSFQITWNHRQDAKASQFSTFSANVDFQTSGYNQSNVNNYYNPVQQSQNITSSSVSYTQRFPESKWSIGIDAGLSQRSADSSITVNAPNIVVNLQRTYPFKRKNGVGKERFYEKIGLTYTMNFQNSITTKEDQLFKSSFVRDWKNGVKHTLPISATFTALKYLNITPTVNNTLRWYFNKEHRDWDAVNQQEVRDTTYGFYNVYDFSVGVSANTKLYGFYTPNRKIFGDKIDRVRHVMTPSVSFNYAPNFGTSFWGYYDSYEKMTIDKNNADMVHYETVEYSPYQRGMYGVPSKTMNGVLAFNLKNNVEMKVRNDKDSTGGTFKKISIIDDLSIGGGYNFAADSMKWRDWDLVVRLKLTKQLTINLRTSFDNYMYAINDAGNPVKVNQLRWNHGQFPLFMGTGTNFQYTINNDTFKRKTSKDKKANNDDDVTKDPFAINEDEKEEDLFADKEKTEFSVEGYDKIKIPWSISLSYTFNWRRNSSKIEDFNYDLMAYRLKYTHYLNITGNVSPTPNWRLNFNGTIDLNEMKITQTTLSVVRDLHCWRLSAQITPFGLYKSYMITVGVNASMLRDLKYEKRSDTSNTINWL